MLTKSIYTRFTFVSLLALVLAGATGCQIFPDRPEWTKNPFVKEKPVVVPTRMMVMWADTVLHQPQKSGVRGFGARIYFYGDEDSRPVKVDGGLAVYAFDADDLNPKSAKPKRKFVFTADQLAECMSHTSMGTSYSVWCPWGEVGGYNETLSLIVRFEGRNGGVVISDSTVKLLPGLNKPAGLAATQRKDGSIAQASGSDDMESSTQLAGFEKASSESTQKPPRRRSETIDLPPSFYRHLIGPSEPLESSPAFFGPALLGAGTPDADAPDGESESREDASQRAGEKESATPTKATPTKATLQRTPYPRRTVGNKQMDAAMEGTHQQSMPSGWIPQLPKTPRYGFPVLPSDGDANQG